MPAWKYPLTKFMEVSMIKIMDLEFLSLLKDNLQVQFEKVDNQVKETVTKVLANDKSYVRTETRHYKDLLQAKNEIKRQHLSSMIVAVLEITVGLVSGTIFGMVTTGLLVEPIVSIPFNDQLTMGIVLASIAIAAASLVEDIYHNLSKIRLARKKLKILDTSFPA